MSSEKNSSFGGELFGDVIVVWNTLLTPKKATSEQGVEESVRITESEVGLKEIVPDGFGGWVERPAKLALPD